MRPGVRYYCPPGVPKPAHRDDLPPGGAELLPGKGPDVAAGDGGAGGGTVYGGSYSQGEPGWVKTAAGWWVHLGTTLPQQLMRAAPNPRVVRWVIVPGAQPEHRWRVPVLLSQQGGEDGTAPLYVSALEREWRGDAAGWQVPTELVAMQEQLNEVAHDMATGVDLASQWQEITDLTLSLLAAGHTATRHEIAAGHWLSELFMLRVLAGACGIESLDGGA